MNQRHGCISGNISNSNKLLMRKLHINWLRNGANYRNCISIGFSKYLLETRPSPLLTPHKLFRNSPKFPKRVFHHLHLNTLNYLTKINYCLKTISIKLYGHRCYYGHKSRSVNICTRKQTYKLHLLPLFISISINNSTPSCSRHQATLPLSHSPRFCTPILPRDLFMLNQSNPAIMKVLLAFENNWYCNNICYEFPIHWQSQCVCLLAMWRRKRGAILVPFHP